MDATKLEYIFQSSVFCFAKSTSFQKEVFALSEAEFEIYADAIANELFTDYKAIEVLATQNQSLFTRLKQWFYRNVIKTSEQTTVLGTKAAQRKTYALMLKAEQAAKNKSEVVGKGKVYSLGSYTEQQKLIGTTVNEL